MTGADSQNRTESRRIAIVGGMRTPFARPGGELSEFDAVDLAVHVVRAVAERLSLNPAMIDELIWGQAIVDPRVSNPARQILFELDYPPEVPAHTVSNHGLSGIHALVHVVNAIRAGRAEIGIAGGGDSSSRPPLLFSGEASAALLAATRALTPGRKLKALARLRLRHFAPEALAIRDPGAGMLPGDQAELLARQWQISREEQDAIALGSHRRAEIAIREGFLRHEIAPLAGVNQDTMVRFDTGRRRLARLEPVFDRTGTGTVTAGNACGLADGAAALVLMNEERAYRQCYQPLALVRDFEFAGLDATENPLLAPALAVPRLLVRNGLTLEDIDLVEVHEAFGSQVACHLKAWQQGWREPAVGSLDPERLNPLGGTITIGHPFAATGPRLVLTLAREMARRNLRYGLVSVGAIGGMAGALLLER